MRFTEIKCIDDMHRLIKELGFLPFFKNRVEGFSVEENIAPELWFGDNADGPWEWKGPLIRRGDIVYGKFISNRAMFVSLDKFPEFANIRRDGYDFDALFDDGKAPVKDKNLFDIVWKNGSIMTRALKEAGNYKKDGNKGFDGIINRLQMQTYICIADFEMAKTKDGREYGWGIARYSTPEYLYGENIMSEAYKHEADESREIILSQLKTILPDVKEAKLRAIIR
ncbi:MAG: hypothetical protein Q4C42_05780 [Clostridia bacterium]|nr:hypothetical protein [Clostridia bacterium]